MRVEGHGADIPQYGHAVNGSRDKVGAFGMYTI